MTDLRTRLAVLLGIWFVGVTFPPLQYFSQGPFDGSLTVGDGVLLLVLLSVGTVAGRSWLGWGSSPVDRIRDGITFGVLIAIAGVVVITTIPVVLVGDAVSSAPFLAGGTVGSLAVFLAGFLAERPAIADERASTECYLAWTVKKQPESRLKYRLDTVSAVVALGLGLFFVATGEPMVGLFWLIFGTAQSLSAVDPLYRRQYEITDGGLITNSGLIPWAKFDGYDLTDDTLVLYGNVWPFGTVAYDRASVDDLDAVVDSLDRYLPQLEGDHDDPSIVDNLRQELLSS